MAFRRPLRGDDKAMTVNWLMIEISDDTGKVTYRNSFITDLDVSRENVAELASGGRARWKIKNETFNVLKTKGYNLEASSSRPPTRPSRLPPSPLSANLTVPGRRHRRCHGGIITGIARHRSVHPAFCQAANAKLTVPLRQRQPDGSGRIFPNRRAAANLMSADGPIRPSHLHHDPQLHPAPGSPDQADRSTPRFWTVSVARCPFLRKARCLRALHWPGLLAAPSMASRARVGSGCQARMIVPTCSPARAFVKFPRTSPLIT
jgi:hypothetical protein